MVETPPWILESNAAVYSRSLKGSTNTIRLLHALQKSRDIIPLEVTWSLEDYKLDSSPSRQYTALLYCWGTSKFSQTIQVNGKQFRVLDSIFPVLEAIRTNRKFSLGHESWWWIDSICTNQNDSDERKSQVKLMGEIYRENYHFVARGEKAIDYLRMLRGHRDSIVKGQEEDRKTIMRLVDSEMNSDWEPVQELLLRPWWRKVWTLQEYLMAPHFEFWCGKKHISKEDCRVAIFAMHTMKNEPEFTNIIKHEAWFPAWNRRRLFLWYNIKKDRLPLVALVAFGSDSKASDPRDRIYSILDLAKGKHEEGLVPEPDYVRKVADVYLDFVLAFVEKHKSLDIICLVHVFNQESKSSKLDSRLPSWVPDWSTEAFSYVIPVMASQSNNPRIGNFRSPDRSIIVNESKAYAASGIKKPEYNFDENKKALSCKGLILNTIQNNAGTKNQGAILTPDKASSILDNVAKTLVLGRKDKYLIAPYSRGTYYHDLRAFCKASTKHPEDVPETLLNWYRQHENLPLGDYTLSEISEQSLEKPGFAQTYRRVDVTEENKFLKRFTSTTSPRGMERKLVTTEEGRFGMGPNRAQPGDKICILLGCSIPVVLRANGGNYEVIGESYLNGFMNGEAIEMAGEGILTYETLRLV